MKDHEQLIVAGVLETARRNLAARRLAKGETKMLKVNADTMRQIVLTFRGAAGIEQTRIIDGVGAVLQLRLPEYQIDTPLRIAHFLAQCAEESAGYRTLVEFSSGVQYNGRRDLGNIYPNDGPRFRGRGLLQITGRDNYARIGKSLGLDLEERPELLNEPEVGLRVSCEFWTSRDLNLHADDDDIVAITQIINGGLNGLPARRTYLAKAKAAIAKLVAGPLVPIAGHPVLHLGMEGLDVSRVQALLRRNGFPLLAVDNNFGPATETAVASFQWHASLDDDGIVGPETWAAFDALARQGMGGV